MTSLLRLLVLLALVAVGGIVLIKVYYDVSWDEAVGIADELVQGLLT